MSVTAFYRVQCSGDCNRWLSVQRSGENRTYGTVTYGSHATVFETWGEADEAAARAGWHDGSWGQYAVCDCGTPTGDHTTECRIVSPWMVPVCPPCRAAA